MYLPPHFKSTDFLLACEIMRRYPFASLISTDDAGFPFVTNLPIHIEAPAQTIEGGKAKLLGHVAKPNPHWRYLQARDKALVSFRGPHAYMSPKVYPDLARVPTWNYIAVECQVQARLIEDVDAKDALLKKLIGDHEPSYAAQWRNLGEEYAHKMLAGIVAFELELLSFECKIKLNQHRPEAYQALMDIYAKGGDTERDLAQWMERMAKTKATAKA